MNGSADQFLAVGQEISRLVAIFVAVDMPT